MKRDSMRYKVLDVIVMYPHRPSTFYNEKLERVASSENIGYAISDLKKMGLVHTTGRSGRHILNAPTKKGLETIGRRMMYFKCPVKACRLAFGIHADCADPFEVKTMHSDVEIHLMRDHSVTELVEALAPNVREAHIGQ